jgi:hypothetical protein
LGFWANTQCDFHQDSRVFDGGTLFYHSHQGLAEIVNDSASSGFELIKAAARLDCQGVGHRERTSLPNEVNMILRFSQRRDISLAIQRLLSASEFKCLLLLNSVFTPFPSKMIGGAPGHAGFTPTFSKSSVVTLERQMT